MANNKVSINIAGINLLVSTPEDEEYVLQIAKEIDEAVTAVLDKTPGASVTNAILLCALDSLDNFKKANRTANNMRSQIKEYMAEAAAAKLQYDEESKKTADLDKEIQTLRNHLTRIAAEGDASGVLEKLREETSQAEGEIKRLRKQNEDLTEQNKALAEKSDAMNTFISEQDREINRLTAVTEEMASRLEDRSGSVDAVSTHLEKYENEIEGLQQETVRLQAELDRLQTMAADAEQQAPLFAPPDDSFETRFPEIPEPAPAEEEAPQYMPDEKAEDAPQPEPAPDKAVDDVPYPSAPTPPPVLTPDDDFGPTLQELLQQQPAAPAPEKEAPAPVSAAQPAAPAEAAIPMPGEPAPPKDDKAPDSRMAAFDIDLSDLPNFVDETSAPPKNGDAFGEFDIEEDDTILGFSSVPRDKALEDAELQRMKNPDAPAKAAPGSEDAVDNVLKTIQKVSAALDQKPLAEDPGAAAPAKPVVEPSEKAAASETAPPDAENSKPAENDKSKEKKKKKAKEGHLENFFSMDDDDDMPNLSWTLDI